MSAAAEKPLPAIARLPLMAAAMGGLVCGLWGGLLRLAWNLPMSQAGWIANHGPLMVDGFLGTLICLERAVGWGRRWTYILPLLTGLGAACLVTGASDFVAELLITAGSLGLLFLFVVILRRHPTVFNAVMGFGAACWAVGNAVWSITGSVPHAMPWWIGFLLFTIAGERLEISRLLRVGKKAVMALIAILILCLVGWTGATVFSSLYLRVSAVGLVLLSLWLAYFDIARRTIRLTGITRFIAVCLLSGYAWLGLGGALQFFYAPLTFGLGYDAVLHSFFLGFVFSMIFGHAPIILPSVFPVTLTYRRFFYAPFLLLHVSLAVRIAGDVFTRASWRHDASMVNAIAILSFFFTMVLSMRRTSVIASRPASGKVC